MDDFVEHKLTSVSEESRVVELKQTVVKLYTDLKAVNCEGDLEQNPVILNKQAELDEEVKQKHEAVTAGVDALKQIARLQQVMKEIQRNAEKKGELVSPAVEEGEDKFMCRAAPVEKLKRTWWELWLFLFAKWKLAMPNLKGCDCRVQASRRSERVALYFCEAGEKETSSAKAGSYTAHGIGGK